MQSGIDVLSRTLWAEARGEGRAGMIAVAWCIRNRVEADLGNDGKPDWWGEGYAGVCQAPWQFSCWNKGDPNRAYLVGDKQIPSREYMLARECAVTVMEGRELDPTKGATHYYSTTMKTPPNWVNGATLSATIGRHKFYRGVK